MAAHKQAQQLARQLAQMSVVDGAVSAERVQGVLDYLEKHRPPQVVHVLRAYHRYIATEIAKSQAIVEHAGATNPETLRSIEAAMTRRYQRPITAHARPNEALIAGLRIRVADDVYESSIDSQLNALADAV